eukprot:jgi/Phyca11/133580/e_gw1.570.9.1
MCVYYRWRRDVLIVVGVYVDDLLVTGTEAAAVDAFFSELADLSVKDLGVASKFLGMRVTYDEEEGYHLDQEVMIMNMLKEFGMENAHAVRTPIGPEGNDKNATDSLPASGGDGGWTVTTFQSLVGSLMWLARCTRPDIAFAVHKASRKRTAHPSRLETGEENSSLPSGNEGAAVANEREERVHRGVRGYRLQRRRHCSGQAR